MRPGTRKPIEPRVITLLRTAYNDNGTSSLHIVAKRRYGLLFRVLAVHALGALALLALARTVHAAFDLGTWYLAKVGVLYVLGTILCVGLVEAHHPFPRYGPANLVTLIRGLLVALIAGLIGEEPMPGPALFAAL